MPLSALADNECPSKTEVDESILDNAFPTGPTPSIQNSADPGGPLTPDSPIAEANWTNTSGTLRPEVQWQVNGVAQADHFKSANATSDTFDTSPYNVGDDVRARVRYLTGADNLVGSGFAASDELPTHDEINAAVDMASSLSAGGEIPTKNDITNNADQTGAYGGLSNTLTIEEGA